MTADFAPAWTRWSIRKDLDAQGNVWDLTHDCGYRTRVDLAKDGLAAVDAERAHERTCSGLTTGDRNKLLELAVNLAKDKPRAREQADSLVPLLCEPLDSLALFDSLVLAVACGNTGEAEGLLDRLVGGQG